MYAELTRKKFGVVSIESQSWIWYNGQPSKDTDDYKNVFLYFIQTRYGVTNKLVAEELDLRTDG